MKSTTAIRTLVLKIGGSFLLADGKPNLAAVTEMADTVKTILKTPSNRMIVVVGGGVPARTYIDAAAALGASEGVKDHFGILVSRLNARLFIEAVGDELAYSEPPETLTAVRSSLQLKPLVVLGGLIPGQSTTAVAALCAEFVKAEQVIFGTDVDGVYDSDPRKNKDAKKLDTINYARLKELTLGKENTLPGQYRLMDGVALTILERSKMPAVILEGTKANILDSFLGKPVGTRIGDFPADK
eukprot:TRINITY_DN40149_c0_g1_i1.p1 TRINITY_DN40149_c0_g1~~TRINITY_DN40149_c0_g1_i1.p1  ORF type:complete len:242 (+),score=52.94 TRINITY_DN40149_c0_g1_i1:47-772(+)